MGLGGHGVKGQMFDAIVKNQTDKPTAVHWHGLIVPNDQDGVPYITQAHCHMLYHQEGGMMTLVNYKGIVVPPLTLTREMHS